VILAPAACQAENQSMKPSTAKWLKYLVAISVGNALYFAINPYLPEPARHHPFKFDLGTLVDFWVCLTVYGLIELVTFIRKHGDR